jgi:predicted RNase H-like nuclease
VHPEVAFWRLIGEWPLDEPKKVKGRPYEAGLALRKRLLIAAGLPSPIAHAPPMRDAGIRAGPDDLLDALACVMIAKRIHAGTAQPFPDSPQHDAHGLPMAIWA